MKGEHLEDQGAARWVILKWIFKKYDKGMFWVIWLRIGTADRLL
jgi:hypothetical protein